MRTLSSSGQTCAESHRSVAEPRPGAGGLAPEPAPSAVGLSSHSLSTKRKPMVRPTGAGRLRLVLQEIICREPELKHFSMNLPGVFDGKDCGAEALALSPRGGFIPALPGPAGWV